MHKKTHLIGHAGGYVQPAGLQTLGSGAVARVIVMQILHSSILDIMGEDRVRRTCSMK